MNTPIELSVQQIDDILSVIPLNKAIPTRIAESIRSNIWKKLRKQLEGIKLIPKAIPELKERIEKEYYKSLITPGESVGILASQSIGERQTQSMLNSFHSAGSAIQTALTGVPRFSELINASKDPKMVVYKLFMKDRECTIDQIRRTLKYDIVALCVKDLVDTFEIYEVDKHSKGSWYDEWTLLFGEGFNDDSFSHVISLKMKGAVMYEKKILMMNLKEWIEDKWGDIYVVVSPDSDLTLDMFIGSSAAVKDDYPNLTDYMEEIVVPNLLKTKLCGVDGINDMYYNKRDKEFYVEAVGTSVPKMTLQSLFANKALEYPRIESNNVWDIVHCLGIEAAREFLLNEFISVVSSDGTFVNDCHIKLLVDTMTQTGTIMSISRYFLKRNNMGPLSKASFEESLDHFLRAGMFGEKENINGVSASIMLGKMPKVGTGICEVIMDVEQLSTIYINDKVVETVN
jgi:DNA-directed RNA polymerase II subunit RPB1